jgi:hypothetical protein
MAASIAETQRSECALAKGKHLAGTWWQIYTMIRFYNKSASSASARRIACYKRNVAHGKQAYGTCEHERVGTAACDSSDEASSELLEQAGPGVRVGRGIGAGWRAVAALAFVVAAPEEELAWMEGDEYQGDMGGWGGGCYGVKVFAKHT